MIDYPVIVFSSNKGIYEKNIVEFGFYATSEWIKKLDLKIISIKIAYQDLDIEKYWNEMAKDLFNLILEGVNDKD